MITEPNRMGERFTAGAVPADGITRLLLWAGVVGPLLFIVVFLIEGATRPGYSAWRNFVSSLSTGDQGWEQIANFIIAGLLVLGFAVALRPALRSGTGATWGPILIGIHAVFLIIAGLFVTDPALGYPPGAPRVQTLHGVIHGLAGLIVFVSLTLACFVIARRFAFSQEERDRPWAAYSLITGLVVIGFFIACTAVSALDESGALPNGPTGLLQRVSIVTGWVWVSLLALRYARPAPRLARGMPASRRREEP